MDPWGYAYVVSVAAAIHSDKLSGLVMYLPLSHCCGIITSTFYLHFMLGFGKRGVQTGQSFKPNFWH
jgi:hypothetical protein